MVHKHPLEVWKFGGASLADAAGVRRVASLVASRGGPLVVVVSALAGVTDALLEGGRRAAQGDGPGARRAARGFLQRHRHVAHQALARGPLRRGVLAAAAAAAREYERLAEALAALAELPPRASDLLLSRGERLACAIVTAALQEAGLRAGSVDATELIATDDRHGSATPDVPKSARWSRRALLPRLARGGLVVVPGFLGRAPDGAVATLGRGGSDLTATLLARALGARAVVLWKDVRGFLTADPRDVPDARVIPELQRGEAAEAAHYGAKVLHPRALIPLGGSRVRLFVRSFLDPGRPGTEISARRTPGEPVKAIATIAGQGLVTVAGKGMLGVPGIAARAFGAVHEAGLSVSTIFQASSESSIGFTLPEADMPRAVASLRRAFREELALSLIDGVTGRGGLAVVAVVGDGMAGTPGIAARVFGALADGGVNVIAIAQGSSERNISFVVGAEQAASATRRVHAAFQLAKIGGGSPAERRHTDVVLLGFGRVGRALTDQLADSGGDVRVVGLLDRSGYVFAPRGLGRARLLRLARAKDQGALLAAQAGTAAGAREALAFVAGHAVSRPVLVDVTAEDTGDLLIEALEQGFDLVLANKKPLSGSRAGYARLHAAAVRCGRRVRYEATVGAGLPILDTFRKLVESGDNVLRVEGCLSGTLGYVLSALSAGTPFSRAVAEAVAKGYAEPDPRDDLSGRDAARKGLILARLLGYAGPLPAAEDLVPKRLARVPAAEFLERLAEEDAAWRERAARAAAQGRVLRYVVSATRRSVHAGLQEVPADSAIGGLRGTRNLVSFTSRRYRKEPLVVVGPGAGAEVTGAGLLNDIHSLAAAKPGRGLTAV